MQMRRAAFTLVIRDYNFIHPACSKSRNNFFCIKKILYICNQIVYLRIIAIYYPSHKSKNDETNRNNS